MAAANWMETAETMRKWLEVIPGEPLLTPADYYSSDAVATLFGIWAGGFAFVVLPWVLYKLIKDKDTVPILVWLGGFVCSLLEPMLDHLGHLWWSLNMAGPVFSGFNLDIPYLIPPCYTFFVAMTGYWSYTVMRRGATMKKIWLVWFVIALSDVIMEIPGCYFYAYMYYGWHPFRLLGFPLFWGWVNGTGFLMVGFLMHLIVPHLKGWMKLQLLLIVLFAFSLNYGIIGWPYFAALNWKMSVPWMYAMTLLSLGFALITVWWIAASVATDSPLKSTRLATAS